MQTLGIVNMTRDSFSDGGRFLDPAAAIRHIDKLVGDGVSVVDLGPASSHPDAETVTPEAEIARMAPAIAHCVDNDIVVSVDSYHTATQRFALGAGVQMLNDIHGFADEAFYPELAASDAKLVVMHAIQTQGAATRIQTNKHAVYDGLCAFFERRLKALTVAGVDEARLIIDPGMGFFLGASPDVSLFVLSQIPDLRRRFGREVLISVSRKSFLQQVAHETAATSGAATLAAELYALSRGASWIRTHDVGALNSAWRVQVALDHMVA